MGSAGAVTNDDGIAETLDADLVDAEVAEVRGGLGIVELSLPRAGLFHEAQSIRPKIRAAKARRR